jgi:Phage tail lysozyme
MALTIRVGLILEQQAPGAISQTSFEEGSASPGMPQTGWSAGPPGQEPEQEQYARSRRAVPHPREHAAPAAHHAPHRAAPQPHHYAVAPHPKPHAAKPARPPRKAAKPHVAPAATHPRPPEPRPAQDKFASRKRLLGGPKPETVKPPLPSTPLEELKAQDHVVRKRLLGGTKLSIKPPVLLPHREATRPKHFAGAGVDWSAHMENFGFVSHTAVMRALVKQGYAPEDAAAIAGNWMHESSGQQYPGKPVILNPATEGYGPPGVNKSGNAAWGAAQWEGSKRKRGLTDPSLESQAKHAWDEMHSYESRSFAPRQGRGGKGARCQSSLRTAESSAAQRSRSR